MDPALKGTRMELSLKVLRLHSPNIRLSHRPGPVSAPWSEWVVQQRPNHSLEKGLNNVLETPSGFGAVYVGQTLQAQLVVVNNGRTDMMDVRIKLDIQTNASKDVALDTTRDRQTILLAPKKTQYFQFSHAVFIPGQHNISCSITYTSAATGQRKTYQRVFKFESSNALKVATIVHKVQKAYVAQISISSTAAVPLFLSKVELTSLHDGVTCQPLLPPSPQSLTASSSPDHLFSATLLTNIPLRPRERRDYAFCLQADDESPSSLAELCVEFRTHYGESGTLKYPSINKPSPVSGSVPTVSVLKAPQSATLHNPFVYTLAFRNPTSSPLPVTVKLVQEKMGALLPNGCCYMPLGTLNPGAQITADVECVAVACGVHSLSGVSLLLPGRSPVLLDNLHSILITQEVEAIDERDPVSPASTTQQPVLVNAV